MCFRWLLVLVAAGAAEGLLATAPSISPPPLARRHHTCPIKPPTTIALRSHSFRSDAFVQTVCYVIGFILGNGVSHTSLEWMQGAVDASEFVKMMPPIAAD